MKDLFVGDQILSSVHGQPHKRYYQPVYSFAHYHPTKEATFKVVHTEDGKMFDISADHLIYVQGSANPKRAGSVRPGDRLAPTGVAVTEIGETTKAGIYAPMTSDGTFLLENGIQVSSYAAIVQDTNNEYVTFRDGSKAISQHTGIHMTLAPYRMWCRVTASLHCKSYNKEGMPHHIARGMRVLEWVNQQHQFVQYILFALAFSVFGFLLVIECILFSGLGLFLVLALAGKMAFGYRASSLTDKLKTY